MYRYEPPVSLHCCTVISAFHSLITCSWSLPVSAVWRNSWAAAVAAAVEYSCAVPDRSSATGPPVRVCVRKTGTMGLMWYPPLLLLNIHVCERLALWD